MNEKKLKIAFLSHLDLNLYLFRLSWMKALLAEGHEVYAIVPAGKYFSRFEEHGIRTVKYDMDRRSANPFDGIATIFRLYRVMSRLKCDILHSFMIKPNIYGSIAGKLAGVPTIINHVTGLGYIYTEKSIKAALLKILVLFLYWIAFKIAKKIIFQNPDDLAEMSHLIKGEKAMIIKGTGIDVEYFSPGNVPASRADQLKDELKLPQDKLVITLIGRLLRHKGIRELIDAAGLLSERYDNLLFLIIGWKDEGNPAVVGDDLIESTKHNGNIRFLGERDDIREILSVSDIYVLPSYREGTPRTVLEAMAMSKPIITTDVPGCRQTVRDGVNGLLVPARDARALKKALERLIDDRELRHAMGRKSREKVVREFSDTIVIKEVMKVYAQLSGSAGS